MATIMRALGTERIVSNWIFPPNLPNFPNYLGVCVLVIGSKSWASRTLIPARLHPCPDWWSAPLQIDWSLTLRQTKTRTTTRQASSSHNQSSLVLVSDCQIKKQIGRRWHCLTTTVRALKTTKMHLSKGVRGVCFKKMFISNTSNRYKCKIIWHWMASGLNAELKVEHLSALEPHNREEERIILCSFNF